MGSFGLFHSWISLICVESFDRDLYFFQFPKNYESLRLHGMSWGVKTTCFKAPGVSLGGSGVSIGGSGALGINQSDEFSSNKMSCLFVSFLFIISHRIHVWYIYLHLP